MRMTKRMKRMRQGVTVWIVHAFADRAAVSEYGGWIDEVVLLGKVAFKSPRTGSNYVHVDYLTAHGNRSDFSLLDMHVYEQQSYNEHRVFFSRRKAENYLKLVQSGCDVRQMFMPRRSFPYDFDREVEDEFHC